LERARGWPVLRRVMREENGIDLDALPSDIRRVLG
jgi:hypothetical protein